MIAVALSGGVDSALAAARLLESGERVVGLFMDFGPVFAPALAQARRVSDHLDIELQVIDLADKLARRVIEPFLAAYQSGLTPNPCARCNRRVKFAELLHKAQVLGADRLATGHYARLIHGPGGPELHRGRQPGKEQSYFLARLDYTWLDRLIFPLGELTKAEVRQEATRLGLPAADSPDSQEICFLGGQDYRTHFADRLPGRPGDIRLADGRVIGHHQGLFNHTVGQRRGLGLSWPEALYVLALEPETNSLVVGPEEELFSHRAGAEEINWLAPEDEVEKIPAEEVLVQVRYRARPVPARLSPADRGVAIDFDRPVRAVAPGQLAAFYRGERLLGGGWLRG